MSLTFWDTVAGHELAEVLKRNLPKIAEALQPKKQFIIKSFSKDNVLEEITQNISRGNRYIDLIESDGLYVAIMEEK